MSLEQLVDYFNDKFAQEHHCTIRPFLVNEGKVSGLFGIAHLKSELTAIRKTSHHDAIIGYTSEVVPLTENIRQTRQTKINRFLEKTRNKPAHVPSIISFDRLCRTLHVLNYLHYANATNFLITDVDPRHILSVPDHHGLYFEQIISHVGLKTHNIVISMNIIGIHEAHYSKLLQGLTNYRELGYPIALNIGYLFSANKTLDFIEKLLPDYIIVNAPHENFVSANRSLLNSLHNLKGLVQRLETTTIMQNIQQKEQVGIQKNWF